MSDWQHSEVLDPTERLVVEFADALSHTPAVVSQELHRRMADRFSRRQVVELSHAIAWEHARARFNRGLGIESDGFSDK